MSTTMSEEIAIKKLIDTMMEIDQLKRKLKEKEKQLQTIRRTTRKRG